MNEWPEEKLLFAVARENNLSETAFFVPEANYFRLRWFTPTCEVNLCGHATLASGFVLLNILEPARESVRFETRGGALVVSRQAPSNRNLLSMDFPALPPWPCLNPPEELMRGLAPGLGTASRSGNQFVEVVQVKDNYFVVCESEAAVRDLQPDFGLLAKLHPFGVAVTAPGKDCDFVSRYFAPSYGISEDPVTGSTHCSLAPYWAKRLCKNELYARQLSKRGGELWCKWAGGRVMIRGNAVLVLRGEMFV